MSGTKEMRGKLAGYRVMYIDAWEMPQVAEFVSVNRREIYINIGAAPGANVVRLAFCDRDLFRGWAVVR